MKRFLVILLLLGALWVLGENLGESWQSPPQIGPTVLAERLGMAGKFSGPLPGGLESWLTQFALRLESDPAARHVLQGKPAPPEQRSELTSGYRLWSQHLKTPGQGTRSELRLMAYHGLIRVLGAFTGFALLLLGVLALPFLNSDESPQGAQTAREVSLSGTLGLFAAWVVGYEIALRLASELVPAQTSPFARVMIALLLNYAVAAGLLAWFWRWGTWRPWRGWNSGWVCAGTLATMLAVPAAEWVVRRVSGVEPGILLSLAPYFRGLEWPQGLVLGAAALLVGPVFEELLFRGWLLGGLVPHLGPGRALLVSSLLFAASHGNLWGFPGPFVFGLITGGLVLRTGSLASSVAVHVFWNATTLLLLVAAI